MRPRISLPLRAFTLIELVFAMLIALVMGLGAIGAIIYTRQSLELDKQRLSALNYCRQAMEAAHTNAGINMIATRPLVQFNAPGVDIPATIRVLLHPLDANGIIVWGTTLAAAPGDQPVFCRVQVDWTPAGSWGRPHSVYMDSILRAGVK